MAELLTNFGRSTMTAGISDSDTSVGVVDGSVFPATGNFRINIGDELMLCTARSSNTLTVTRGIEGTTAVAHSTGKYVTQVATAGAVVELIDERMAPALLYAYQNFK
jgi:hypothetical protein